VITFTLLDKRIWFRNFEIHGEDGSLTEIGPRFVMNVIKMFEGSFGGPVIYSNPDYVNPNVRRRMIKMKAQDKYKNKVLVKKGQEERQPGGKAYVDYDQMGEIFETIPSEKAKGLEKTIFQRHR
jgi:ribosome biogenesis protein BRX1 homolog